MTGTFNAAATSDVIFLKPGEVLQYLLAAVSGNVIANIRLQRSTNGGQTWETVRGPDDTLENWTGTVGVPLTGTITSHQIKNEGNKGALYRWNCVTFNLVSSDSITWSLINAVQASQVIGNGVCIITNNEAPVDGVLGDGVGFAGGGSIYIDYSTTTIWFNNGTAAAPDWDAFA